MNLCTELPKAAEGDRGHLFAVCDLMTTFAEQSRHEGILALEEWLEYDEASGDFSHPLSRMREVAAHGKRKLSLCAALTHDY